MAPSDICKVIRTVYVDALPARLTMLEGQVVGHSLFAGYWQTVSRFGETKDDISPGNYNSSFSEGSITEVFRREWLDVSVVVLPDTQWTI